MRSRGKPLKDKGVVVTREEGSDGPLSSRLSGLGAQVFHWPCTQTREPDDTGPLEEALSKLESYDWIIFSSGRAVEAVTRRVERPFIGPRIAAVGKATAKVLQSSGWSADFVPESFSGSALVEAFAKNDWAVNVKVLFPASSIAHETITNGLRGLGANLDRVTAYETVPAPLDPKACLKELKRGTVQAVTFTSPSAVKGLLDSLGSETVTRLLSQAPAVAIGPTTVQALEECGQAAEGIAKPSTLDGLVEAVVKTLVE